MSLMLAVCFFFQAEDGIRDLVRSRGLGDVYKRQNFARTKIQQAPASGARQASRLSPVHTASMKAQRLSLIHI